jgi:hypothetical protein
METHKFRRCQFHQIFRGAFLPFKFVLDKKSPSYMFGEIDCDLIKGLDNKKNGGE